MIWNVLTVSLFLLAVVGSVVWGAVVISAWRELKRREHALREETPHVHAWYTWAADARYQRCSTCGKTRYVGSEVQHG